MIRSRNTNPEFIFCSRKDIKYLPSHLKNAFILVDSSEFQSVHQAALYLESNFPQSRRDLELIQLVLLVGDAQLIYNPEVKTTLCELAKSGINWYIAETCGLGPLPPRNIDLDMFRNQFVKKPFKQTLQIS